MSIKSIRICYGLAFDVGVSPSGVREYLQSLKYITKKTENWYLYKKKKISYEIKIHLSKQEFLDALTDKNAIVIYEGHSRYGQGPVFINDESYSKVCGASQTALLNPWEDHVRMGWDVVKTLVIEDMLTHGTNPTEYDEKIHKSTLKFVRLRKKWLEEKKSKKKSKLTCGKKCTLVEKKDTNSYEFDCTCEVKKEEKKIIQKRKFSTYFPTLADQEIKCTQKQSLRNRHFWKLKVWKKKIYDFLTLIISGRDDLMTLDIKCRVFFMNSCLSAWHFYCALKNRLDELKRSNYVLFLTMDEAMPWLADTTLTFIKLLLRGRDPTNQRDAIIMKRRLNSYKIGGKRIQSLTAGKIVISTGKRKFAWEEKIKCPSWSKK